MLLQILRLGPPAMRLNGAVSNCVGGEGRSQSNRCTGPVLVNVAPSSWRRVSSGAPASNEARQTEIANLRFPDDIVNCEWPRPRTPDRARARNAPRPNVFNALAGVRTARRWRR